MSYLDLNVDIISFKRIFFLSFFKTALGLHLLRLVFLFLWRAGAALSWECRGLSLQWLLLFQSTGAGARGLQ